MASPSSPLKKSQGIRKRASPAQVKKLSRAGGRVMAVRETVIHHACREKMDHCISTRHNQARISSQQPSTKAAKGNNLGFFKYNTALFLYLSLLIVLQIIIRRRVDDSSTITQQSKPASRNRRLCGRFQNWFNFQFSFWNKFPFRCYANYSFSLSASAPLLDVL